MKFSSKKNGNYVKVLISKLSKSLQVKLGIFINIQAINLSVIFAVNCAEYAYAKEKEQLIFCNNEHISIKTGKDQKYCKEIIDCLINFLSGYPSHKLVVKVQCWDAFNAFRRVWDEDKNSVWKEFKPIDDIIDDDTIDDDTIISDIVTGRIQSSTVSPGTYRSMISELEGLRELGTEGSDAE